MGQKVHPLGFRLGIIRDWYAKWYADKNKYTDLLHEDFFIRKEIEKAYSHAGIAYVLIKRVANRLTVKIFSSRPGIVIGKKGADIENFRKYLRKVIEENFGQKRDVFIEVEEIKKPDLHAPLVAENIARQLEKRVNHRKAMKQAIARTMKAGALGIKIEVSGRIGGAEIARTERVFDGKVPLQTLRADVDYSLKEALTTYGRLGIKVWIYRGEVHSKIRYD